MHAPPRTGRNESARGHGIVGHPTEQDEDQRGIPDEYEADVVSTGRYHAQCL